RNGSKDFKDFKATSHRFGRLTQIQTFSPRGIVRYACRIKNLKTVAYGTQLRALNSPGPAPLGERNARAQDRQVQVQADRGGARQQAGADRLCARDQRRPLRRPSGRGLNEQAPQERGFAARRSASRATAKRCEPTERLGSPAKGRRHSERVLLNGRRAMRTNIRASGTFVSAPTGRRHDRTRS